LFEGRQLEDRVSSGREGLGYAIGHKSIGADAVTRRRTDVVADAVPGRPQVFLDIAIGGSPVGRLVIELYADAVPRTSENFRSLCTGIRGIGKRGKALHYKGSTFHRVIPNFMCQGGDITHGNGSGGESIFGTTFADESLTLKHTTAGILSMANSGKNTNASQFFITTKACPHLDGKHVVFGRVVEGLEVIRNMEDVGSESGSTSSPVIIDDCGELRGSAKATNCEADGAALGNRSGKRKRAADMPSEVRLFHILKKHAECKDPVVSRTGQATKASKTRAQLGLTNIRRRLVTNQGSALQVSFIEIAREQSDCKTATKGGDLGTIAQGTLESKLEEAAFSLMPGELSEVVESPEGLHLMLRIA